MRDHARAEFPDRRLLNHGVALHGVIHAPRFHDKALERELWRSRSTEEGQAAYRAALADPMVTNLNFHAHIMFTTREVDGHGRSFGKKTQDLDRVAQGPLEVARMRAEWEKRVNSSLARIGSDSRIDLRSYERMAQDGDAPHDLTAQPHIGPKSSARSRRMDAEAGDGTSLAGRRRNGTRELNEQLWLSWEELRRLRREHARKEGASQQIAAGRERERRAEALAHKQRLREASGKEAVLQAIDEAGSIDAAARLDPIQQALRWARGEAESPEVDQAFEESIDPETFENPDTKAAPKAGVRVVRSPKSGERQRTRSD